MTQKSDATQYAKAMRQTCNDEPFFDASFAANKVTRKSHSGHIVFVNWAQILWFSQRQNTIDASAVLAEFIVLKLCVQAVVHLRFKLQMFGICIKKGML